MASFANLETVHLQLESEMNVSAFLLATLNPKAELLKSAKPQLQHFWYYAKVELAPPKISEIPQVFTGFAKLINAAKSGAWKQVTVKQAVVNTLVGTEVICWFFIGECIGKRHIVGYKLH